MSRPMTTLPRNQVLVGDALQQLRTMPASTVDCVITSPPYFRQRDYGVAGQLGAETHVDDWVHGLLQVCRELGRVLKPQGALWLNLGDGYSRHVSEGSRRKSLLLGPQRAALALAADGWLLRNQVIWSKTNPMPSSVSDRLSCTHEVLYFLTRNTRYYFDLDAIRDTPKQSRHSAAPQSSGVYPPRAAVPSTGKSARINLNGGLSKLRAAGRSAHPGGKNPGDVWRLPTASYRGAHFATFPVELLRRPLLSTCPALVCRSCGLAWRRQPERTPGPVVVASPLEPACTCHAEAQPGIVLDPFLGAGTVALAAEQHRRAWLGIELNPAFAQLTEDRLQAWRARQQLLTEKS